MPLHNLLLRAGPTRRIASSTSSFRSCARLRALSTSTSSSTSRLTSTSAVHNTLLRPRPRAPTPPRHISKQIPRGYATTPMAAETDTQATELASSTGITPATLSETLQQKLEATHVDIQDISGGCGASFTALIVSPLFQGKTALARHRLVNTALKTEIAAIHAWTPRCLTPEQWEKLQAENAS